MSEIDEWAFVANYFGMPEQCISRVTHRLYEFWNNGFLIYHQFEFILRSWMRGAHHV